MKDLILPSICLALAPAAVLARLTRSSILEVAPRRLCPYPLALKDRWNGWLPYANVLRNAMIPVVTVIGLQFASMLGGAVFIESVFARPGLGRFAVNAFAARDFPQIQGMVLFTASIYALLNLFVDIAYSFLDPRIRYE